MPFADVNGQTLHYVDSGGDGPAVVLSHGFSMGFEMWDPQVGPLVDAGWRVVTYDERGWGQTVNTEPFTYWDLADDVLGLMEHLGIEAAVLGGMSQGGFLSLRATLTAPERVRALFIVDSEAEALGDEDRAQFQGLFDAALLMGMAGEMGDLFQAVLFAPGFEGAAVWRAKWNARPLATWAAAKECLFERDSVADRIGEITCPALVVHGDVDAAIPIERGRALADGLGGPTTFVEVSGAGHSANLEDPGTVNAALLAFLADLA
ncbi:MAG: alpha/beta hydrolase [Acidimicrobiales bacterium]|jgi:pimeloyl-ACP methyl ester carboxylesterase|nr:alpha/beta hydrolase [Acidimicrobiales bacterium]